MDDGGDRTLQPLSPGILLRRTGSGHHLPHPLHHRGGSAGLHQEVVRSPGRRQFRHAAPGKAGQDQHPGLGSQLSQLGQSVHPVQSGEDHVHHHDVGLVLAAQLDKLRSVRRLPYHRQVCLTLYQLRQKPAKFLSRVRYHDLLLIHTLYTTFCLAKAILPVAHNLP